MQWRQSKRYVRVCLKKGGLRDQSNCGNLNNSQSGFKNEWSREVHKLIEYKFHRKDIESVFRNHGFNEIKIAHQPGNKIYKYTRSMKDKLLIMEEKGFEYQINCKNCEKFIQDIVVQIWKKSLYEHKNNMKESSKTNTALFTFMKDNKHVADWDGIKILSR